MQIEAYVVGRSQNNAHKEELGQQDIYVYF